MCSSCANSYKHAKCNFVVVIILFCLLFFNPPARFVEATQTEGDLSQELENSISQEIENLDLTELEDYFNQNYDYFQSVFSVSSYQEFLTALISGEVLTDFNSVFLAISSSIKQNISVIVSPLMLILVIVLLLVLFNNIKPKFASDSVSQVIFFICFSVVTTIVTYLMKNVLLQTLSSITKMQNQMNGIFPILMLLMNTAGGSISVKAYQPLVLTLSNLVSNVFVKILFPIVIAIFVLSVIGNLSPKIKVKNLSDFFSSLFKWIIGLIFTVYMSFMTIQGITASGADGISIKTAKYAIKNYIPMLGGYISDGFEVARVGAHIIKNAIGFSGIVFIIITILSPILFIAVMQLALKLIAGLVEPISDGQTSGLLNSVAKTLSLLMVVIVGVAMMYFVIMFLFMCSVSGGI